MKKSFYLFYLALSFIIFGCNKGPSELDIYELKMRENALLIHNYSINLKRQKQIAYENFIKNTSLEEKICQLFIVNLEGNTKFFPVENMPFDNLKNEPLIPGGYLFFSYNLGETPKQIMTFTKSIEDYCNSKNMIVPFLAIDHEGGVVNRLRKINAPLPSCLDISNNLDLQNTYLLYEYQAKQLSLLGFNMNLAPVCEILNDSNKGFLGDRSFGDKDKVVNYSIECVNAYQDNKIATVVKHFPGNTNTDPHLGLPVIDVSLQDLEELLFPFEQLIKENPAGILMSHAIVNSVDKGVPSCLSNKWVSQILRNQYGYEGIIFSDDIFMAALSKNGYPSKEAVIMAINAGIDCIMVSEKKIGDSVKILFNEANSNQEFEEKINESFKRIVDYKLKAGILNYSENEDGSFVIKSALSQDNIDQRINQFNEIKELNKTFCDTNF